VSPVVNLCTLGNASHVPTIVRVDMQRDRFVEPRLADAFHRSRFHRNHKVTYLRDASAGHASRHAGARNPSRRLQDFRSPGRDI
jgi:hypothetical protein